MGDGRERRPRHGCCRARRRLGQRDGPDPPGRGQAGGGPGGGVRREKRGRGAAIVPAPGAHPTVETILAALKDRLARFKQPRVIALLPEPPRNAMGKVQKD